MSCLCHRVLLLLVRDNVILIFKKKEARKDRTHAFLHIYSVETFLLHLLLLLLLLLLGNARSAVIPAVGLIVVMGILSAVGFSWIGQVCHYTGAKSYTEAWAKTLGPGTSSIPAWSTTTKTFLACLAFSMVLADSLTALVPIDSRTTVLWSVTGLILLPLCWLKNLKSLAPFSLVGVMGMVYTAMAMTYRFARGSYLGGSPLLSDLPEHLTPAFGTKGIKSVVSPQSVLLVSMLSTAYMARTYECLLACSVSLENVNKPCVLTPILPLSI